MSTVKIVGDKTNTHIKRYNNGASSVSNRVLPAQGSETIFKFPKPQQMVTIENKNKYGSLLVTIMQLLNTVTAQTGTTTTNTVTTKSAESGTTITNIKITSHGLKNGDVICNASRSYAKRTVTVVDVDNITVSTVTGQTSGDSIIYYSDPNQTPTQVFSGDVVYNNTRSFGRCITAGTDATSLTTNSISGQTVGDTIEIYKSTTSDSFLSVPGGTYPPVIEIAPGESKVITAASISVLKLKAAICPVDAEITAGIKIDSNKPATRYSKYNYSYLGAEDVNYYPVASRQNVVYARYPTKILQRSTDGGRSWTTVLDLSATNTYVIYGYIMANGTAFMWTDDITTAYSNVELWRATDGINFTKCNTGLTGLLPPHWNGAKSHRYDSTSNTMGWVEYAPMSGLQLQATMNSGAIQSVAVVNGGNGYTGTIDVVVQPTNGGSGAVLSVTATNGVITAVTVTNGGSGYNSTPNIMIRRKMRVIVTTDNGVTFAEKAYRYNPTESRHGHHIDFLPTFGVVDSSSGMKKGMYIATYGDSDSQIYWMFSIDGMLTWNPITLNSGTLSGQAFRTLKISTYDRNTICWGADSTQQDGSQFYKATLSDTGDITNVQVLATFPHSIWGHTKIGNKIVVITSCEVGDYDLMAAIWVSEDNGITWSKDLEWHSNNTQQGGFKALYGPDEEGSFFIPLVSLDFARTTTMGMKMSPV